MGWKTTALLLGCYGFVKEFRPLEPYLSSYYTSYKNLTSTEINEDLFPLFSYTELVMLPVMFMVTDLLRYKPILIVQGLTATASYAMITWSHSLRVLQVMEVLYGIMWSADVSFFTYLFAQSQREHFGDMAAVSRVSYLLGRCLCGAFGQLGLTFGLYDRQVLAEVTFGAMIVSTILVIFLPNVKTSIYFHKEAALEDGSAAPRKRTAWSDVLKQMWQDFQDAYSQPYVLKWSLWWAVAFGVYMMELTYIQLLWEEVLSENGADTENEWNGGVEALYTLLGAGGALLATRGKFYKKWGDLVLTIWCFVSGGLICLGAGSSNMVVQYVVYITFSVLYQAILTVASSEVAQHVRDDSQALVYGFNTFIATVLQVILTYSVAGEGGLELSIRAQFYTFGGVYLVVGVLFAIFSVYSFCKRDQKPA